MQRTDLQLGAGIAARLLDFSAKTLAVVKTLPRDLASRHVAAQLVRSATAAGANYEEARGAESPGDFIHKLAIALKEIREALFWLRLIERSALTTIPLPPLISEANQLAAILGASIRTAKANTQH
jgi:four helix bundle protein